jgi:hypothetical protein
MGIKGRELQPGDMATTDYNAQWRPTKIGLATVEIVERREQTGSQSGIQFRARPNLRNGHALDWYDADWFEPANGD